MSNRESSKTTDKGISPLILNLVGALFTYGIVTFFCLGQLEGETNAGVWLRTFSDNMCITTFTYVFVTAVGNIVAGSLEKDVIPNFVLIILDVFCIISYMRWGISSLPIASVLLFISGVLLIVAFILIHLMTKNQERGQADSHSMKEEDENSSGGRTPES